jgi:hypothetical protein
MGEPSPTQSEDDREIEDHNRRWTAVKEDEQAHDPDGTPPPTTDNPVEPLRRTPPIGGPSMLPRYMPINSKQRLYNAYTVPYMTMLTRKGLIDLMNAWSIANPITLDERNYPQVMATLHQVAISLGTSIGQRDIFVGAYRIKPHPGVLSNRETGFTTDQCHAFEIELNRFLSQEEEKSVQYNSWDHYRDEQDRTIWYTSMSKFNLWTEAHKLYGLIL